MAAAVDETLSIDPLLAAAMLERAADAVWLRLRERVLCFVECWHKPGRPDRAIKFMVTTGKPEFANLVWPLASNSNNEIQFALFQAADRFRPGVLGGDREARLRALPASQRKLALAEIAHESGFDGMELATKLAMGDPDPEVVVEVVRYLDFRGGDRHVNRIMQAAPDATWKALGEMNYPERLTDAALDARLAEARVAAREEETHPGRLLHLIADSKPADGCPRRTLSRPPSPVTELAHEAAGRAPARPEVCRGLGLESADRLEVALREK